MRASSSGTSRSARLSGDFGGADGCGKHNRCSVSGPIMVSALNNVTRSII